MLTILLFFLIIAIVIAIAFPIAYKRSNRNLTSDVAFQNVEYTGGSVLENFYDAPIQNPSWEDVMVRIRKMIDVNDEHVLLTLKQATYGVRYMQAASAPGGYDLQVGMEEGDQTRLVDKIVAEQELFDRFETFYRYGYVDNLGEFKPVQFYR
ncbi:MAG: hypothetical protein K5770_04735 [Lachnospiraceae bacterium]|nr:hypothetical protein [Lachnospiraceae bacterium]